MFFLLIIVGLEFVVGGYLYVGGVKVEFDVGFVVGD